MATEIKSTVAHPLEPLTPGEILAAVACIRADRPLTERARFVSVTLKEPTKQEVLAYRPGDPIVRRAFVVLLDKSSGFSATFEIVVNLTIGSVESWTHIPGAQPSIMFEEFFACESAVKAHPDFQEALRKRGITDFDRVHVDPWSAGNYGTEEENTRRILRATVHMRFTDDPHENSYSHPVEGLHALFDLNTMEVVRIDDFGTVPIPQMRSNYVAGTLPERTIKPLSILQPDGPSFAVDGHHVQWDNWSLRIGFSPREGLILYDIGFKDGEKVRPILYRAALSEMVVPYGDASPNHARQNAFDVGEYGVGWLANSLELGCDCLGHIHYFDAHMTDGDGSLLTIKNAVCMHEEDHGILWKHFNFRTEHTEVRRSRRLVISFIASIGIYEYGFFWYFYQDGTIQHELKLTGIMNVGAFPPGEKPRYGKQLAPGLYSPIHQHFFCFRLDTNIDGSENSVVEEHTESVPLGPENPYANAFRVQSRLLKTEQEAQRDIDPFSARTWKVINPGVINPMSDEPVGYQLMSSGNVLPFAHESSSFMQRAGFTKHHVWVTPYDPQERFPAGDYPNQHKGGEGLPAWTQANRSIENTSLVLWHNVGVHHAARVEDWPVMPVSYAGFMMRPHGFFSQNPALDVAPQSTDPHESCDHTH